MTVKINADTSDGLKFVSDTSGEIDLQTNGTTKVHMDSSGNVGIGTSSPNYPLDIEAGALGGTSGDTVNLLELYHTNTNGSYLRFEGLRTSTGSNWQSAGTRIQQVIDVTDHGYIQFNGDSNDEGISFGKGTSTEHMRIDSSGNLKFNSGYGSAETTYGVRAWVNFNGTGTVAIRESGGVSSVADRGTGQYTVVLSTAMPDNNYCGVTSAIHDISSSTNRNRIANAFTKDTNEVYVNSFDTGGNASDVEQINVVIVR